MAYLVERKKPDGTWETVYSEADAEKADLLMEALLMRSGGFSFYSGQNVVQVHWVAAEQTADGGEGA